MFDIIDTIIKQTSENWKGFSNNDEEKESFQTAVIERKMKNIKNRKNRKRMKNNYKNIETFTVLTNDFSNDNKNMTIVEPMSEQQQTDQEINQRRNQHKQNLQTRKINKQQRINAANHKRALSQQNIDSLNEETEDIKNKRQERYDAIDKQKLEQTSIKNELISNNLKKYIAEINAVSDNKIEGMTGNIDNDNDNDIDEEEKELSHAEKYPYDATKVDIDDKNNKYTYEGHYDDDSKGNTGDDWQSKVARAVDELYEKILYVNTQLANKLADAISKNNATEKDKKILKEYIGSILAGIVSLAVSYNWYNIMYVVPKDKIFNLEIEDLQKLSSVPGFEFIQLLLFLFEFALFFPVKMNTIITDYIPAITKKYLSGKINFLLIFGATFYGIRNLSRKVKDFFIAIVKGGSNTVLGLMFGIVVLNFLISYVKRISSPEGLYELQVWSIPFYLLKMFIRFIIIMIVSVPVGGLLMLMYILTYSLFSMFIYPSGSFLNTIKTVIQYCNNAEPEFKNESCDDDGFFMKLFRMVIRIISLFKNQAVLIVLLYVVSNYWYTLNSELSDVSTIVPGLVFKDFFNFFNILFIVPIVAWLVIGSLKIMKIFEDAKNISESSKGEENATILSYILLLLIFFSVIYSFFGFKDSLFGFNDSFSIL